MLDPPAPRSLDVLLEADQQARVVWTAVARLDLSRWLREIRAVEGHVERDATSLAFLVALWVYATLDGVSSAREAERLCGHHLACQWLCGGVSVNYRLLAAFRSQHGEERQQLAAGKDPYAAKPKDTSALKAWRARMKEAASKAMYRLRSQTAEWVNAIFRNRGMQQMPIRGRAKCQAVAVLYAITHNLLIEMKLRAKAAQSGK